MSLHDFIFSKKPNYRISRHVLFWFARTVSYYIVLWGVYFSMPIENENTIEIKNAITAGYIGTHVFFDIIYTYVIVYALIPSYFRPKKYLQFWALITIFSALVFFSKAFVDLYMAGVTGSGDQMTHMFWEEIHEFSNSLGQPAICALFIAIRMAKNWSLNQEQKMILARENAKAELEILKAQVHPHFLFNTLNNIYYFAVNKSFDAPVLLDKLAAIINYMMHDCEAPYVSLEKELAMLENYLRLQEIRYGERLRLETQIPGSFGDELVTPLLLIPFVENSFKHGAGKILNGPFILLSIEIIDGFLHFALINNKPPDEKNSISTNGIGLNNVKKRLELLYPQNHSLKIDQDIDTFNVKLTIPVFSAPETGKNKSAYAR